MNSNAQLLVAWTIIRITPLSFLLQVVWNCVVPTIPTPRDYRPWHTKQSFNNWHRQRPTRRETLIGSCSCAASLRAGRNECEERLHVYCRCAFVQLLSTYTTHTTDAAHNTHYVSHSRNTAAGEYIKIREGIQKWQTTSKYFNHSLYNLVSSKYCRQHQHSQLAYVKIFIPCHLFKKGHILHATQ